MSSGKKGKKNKGTVISLQSFLADGDVPSGTTQVSKKIRNVEGEESDDGGNNLPLVYQLPTAPRANRIFEDDSIPHKPPFIAYITNLPFDVVEDDVYNFFANIQIVSLRLPREDGESGRVRGFGYLQLDSRDDLIDILSLPDPSIKGRRIRIELSNENELHSNKQRSGRRTFDGFGNSNENRESTNWRQDSTFHSNNDKGFSRDRKTLHEESVEPGSWRLGHRSQASDFSPKREKNNDVLRDFSGRSRNYDRNEHEGTATRDTVQERPKLNLMPRTLPLPEAATKPNENACIKMIDKKDEQQKIVKQNPIPSEKIFGSAKPVDTAAREKEIEDRVNESRRQELFQQERDQTEVNSKLSEINLDKTDKENANSAISWRRKNDIESTKRESKHSSPDRKQLNREKDYNRQNKNREKNERADNVRLKREHREEKIMPKYQTNQVEPILQSSNKYFGLDDEASE